MLPRHAALLSAVPTAYPPLPAARARPRAGLISDPGLVPTASSTAGWHGVRFSAGCFVDYYLLTTCDGARPPLEPSAALPHTAAPLIPLLNSHFLTIPVRSFMPAQRQPRPFRLSSQLWAGVGRGRGASSASVAAAAAPRARNRALSSARLGCGGRTGTVCRWLPRVVGRTVPLSNSCQLHTRTCPNSLHTSLRPVRLTFGVFLYKRLSFKPNLIQHEPLSSPNCLVSVPGARFYITMSLGCSESTIVHDAGYP